MKKSNSERIIVLAYSAYAVVLLVAATVLGWPAWINVITLLGLLSLWLIYLREMKSYRFRALFYTAVALTTFGLYSGQESSFEGMMTTFCAVTIILCILGVPEIVVPEYLFSVLLIGYHGLVLKTIPFETPKEKLLSAAQVFALFAVVGVSYHLIKRNGAAQQKTQQLIAQMENAERRKLDLLANISQEIRSPVEDIHRAGTAILAETISRGAEQEALRVQKAGMQLAALTDDVLLFSRLESGRVQLNEHPYRLADTIDAVLEMADRARQGKDLQLLVDCDARIPGQLLGDEPMLRRVLWQLVENAVQFTDSGCVSMEITAREEGYGVNLCVKVRDTGAGIAEDRLETLFDSFDQLDADGKREGGIGLGLAICKKLAGQMNGFLTVKSEPGKGSEFQLVIPQQVADRQPLAMVQNAKDIQFLFCIDTEKPALAKTRDRYLAAIDRMMESLGLRYRLCRSLEECKRRWEKEGCTHLLITQEEYRADPVYFAGIGHRRQVIVIQDEEPLFSPEKSTLPYTPIRAPFYAPDLAALLNETADHPAPDPQPPAPIPAPRPAAPAPMPPAPPKPSLIDRQVGLRYFDGSEENYRDVLAVYLSVGQEELPKIQQKYDEADWDYYNVLVHSLKSTSLGIGATSLGEAAKALEDAARSKDIDYIRANHQPAMDLYRQVLAQIGRETADRERRAQP